MSHKKYVVLIASIISLFFCISAFAGQWQQDGNGWKYKNDDSSYVTNAWHQDPDQRWYYLGPDGYMLHDQWIEGQYYLGSSGAMLTNTTTPDGYWVGADGKYMAPTESANVYNTSYEYYRGSVHCITDVTIVYPDQFRGPKSGITHTIKSFSVDKNGNLFVSIEYVPGSSFGIYTSRTFEYSYKKTVNGVESFKTDTLHLYADSGATNEFIMNLSDGIATLSDSDTMHISYTFRFR